MITFPSALVVVTVRLVRMPTVQSAPIRFTTVSTFDPSGLVARSIRCTRSVTPSPLSSYIRNDAVPPGLVNEITRNATPPSLS